MQHILIVFVAFTKVAISQHNPNFFPNRSGIVHLFEWKFNDIARECETYLSPHGFAGVQVKTLFNQWKIMKTYKSCIIIGVANQ